MRGAGGTEGGIGRFFGGLAMLVVGLYLLLRSISVTSGFAWGYPLVSFGGVGVTAGTIMFPFMIGIGMVFYSSRSVLGWILAGSSLLALLAGIIFSLHFRLRNLSAFDLITILVLIAGGAGLLLSSLRTLPPRRRAALPR